jgi:hypothetical protein
VTVDRDEAQRLLDNATPGQGPRRRPENHRADCVCWDCSLANHQDRHGDTGSLEKAARDLAATVIAQADKIERLKAQLVESQEGWEETCERASAYQVENAVLLAIIERHETGWVRENGVWMDIHCVRDDEPLTAAEAAWFARREEQTR